MPTLSASIQELRCMVETLSEAIEAITFGTKANTSSWIKRAGRSLMIFSARATRGRRKMRRAAWSSSCSRNAHDQNVLVRRAQSRIDQAALQTRWWI